MDEKNSVPLPQGDRKSRSKGGKVIIRGRERETTACYLQDSEVHLSVRYAGGKCAL